MADCPKPKAREARESALRERFPARLWISLGIMLLAQLIAYCATRPLVARMPLRDLATPLDARIPFAPAWVTVYFLAYVSWVVSALWVLPESPARGYRIACAYALAMFLAAVAFLALPGTIRRPEPAGEDFFSRWVRLLYRLDAPTNLCPSLHVVSSYFCWRGAMGCRRVPRWYAWFNLVFLILVCLSVLFVKQHALVDIPAALIVAEVSLQAARLLRLERVPLSLARRFGKKN